MTILQPAVPIIWSRLLFQIGELNKREIQHTPESIHAVQSLLGFVEQFCPQQTAPSTEKDSGLYQLTAFRALLEAFVKELPVRMLLSTQYCHEMVQRSGKSQKQSLPLIAAVLKLWLRVPFAFMERDGAKAAFHAQLDGALQRISDFSEVYD
jgi:hypothetical protein